MKRVNNLYESLISEENLREAIDEVNRTHHWRPGHKPNKTTAWVERTKEERVKELKSIIENGYEQKPPRVMERYDVGARKWRTISEPIQYPDQYIHHALIQVLQPVMMRGMDRYCCGSIRGRGTHYAKKAIETWMLRDIKGTKYCLCADIRHFYDNLKPVIVLDRMKELVKDRKVLDIVWLVTKDGVKIGAYPSQWFANTTLQPLDMMIRQSGLCSHYVRYMDNLTIFGANKRKLKKLKNNIEKWLNRHLLELKDDWQIYPVSKRMPDAVGYKYGRGYTIPRKHNLLRLRRSVKRYKKRMRENKRVPPRLADSILSRLGQIKHCNNTNLYRDLFRGKRIAHHLKEIVREQKKGMLLWDAYMAVA